MSHGKVPHRGTGSHNQSDPQDYQDTSDYGDADAVSPDQGKQHRRIPAATRAEQNLIGNVLAIAEDAGSEWIVDVVLSVPVDHWHDRTCREARRYVERLHNQGRAIDALFMADAAQNEGDPDSDSKLLTISTLLELMYEREDYLQRDHAQKHADAVTEAALNRVMIGTGAQLSEAAYERNMPKMLDVMKHGTATLELMPGTRKRLRPITLSDDRSHLLKAQWAVKDVIPRSGTTMLIGGKNAYKSSFALTLLAYIAAGRQMLGDDRHIGVSDQACLYADGEGDADTFQARLLAIMTEHSFTYDEQLRVSERIAYVDLINAGATLTNGQVIPLLEEEARELPLPLGMVCVDSWSTAHGLRGEGGENDASTSIGAMQQLNEFAKRHDCPVIIPSHASKVDRQSGGVVSTRGSSVVDDQAWATAKLTVSDAEAMVGEYVLQHTRSAPNRHRKLSYRLVIHSIGESADGLDSEFAAITFDDVPKQAAPTVAGRQVDTIVEALGDAEFGVGLTTGELADATGLTTKQLNHLKQRESKLLSSNGITITRRGNPNFWEHAG